MVDYGALSRTDPFWLPTIPPREDWPGFLEQIDQTAAIKRTIAAAAANGGGIVYFPRGTHLVREPLKWGMRLFAWVHRIDPQEYRVRTPACTGCLRFYKVALKERSPVFRRLNDWVNPLFDAWLERFITPDELAQAQAYARRASDGEVPSDEAQAWLPGPKVGF